MNSLRNPPPIWPLFCTFECLTGCPIQGYDCMWDDPDIDADHQIEYPEYFLWRWDNEELVKPEPRDPMKMRCPRCFSIEIVIGYPSLRCENCGYDEELIDFPITASLEQLLGFESFGPKEGTQ